MKRSSPISITELPKKAADIPAYESAADLFTSTVVTYAVSAAWELGLLDAVRGEEAIDMRAFAESNDLHLQSLEAMVDILACRDILLHGPNHSVSPGALFDELYEAKGFFYWLTRGCGRLFETLPELVHNSERRGDFIKRDMRAVGVACRDMGRYFFDSPLDKFLADRDFTTMADLGCGSGERLIRVANDKPNVCGVGVDISSRALKLAGEAIHTADLDERISLVRADARHLSPRKLFNDVELVTCYLMGHDLWPREACIDSLQRIRKAFPKANTLVLCDTYRSETLPTPHPALFTPGFEFAHAVMGVSLPTLDDWLGVFTDGGWQLEERKEIPTPSYTSMFILTPL